MSDGQAVSADGAVDRGERGRPGVMVGAVALALVVSATVAVVRGSRPETPPADGPVPPAPTEVEPGGPPTPADLIAGFRGTIAVAVSGAESEEARVLTWPSGEPSPHVTLLGGVTRLSFDAAGAWVAGLDPAPGPTGTGRLYVGRTGGRLLPLTRPVSGFSWHDTAPGQLAFALDLPVRAEVHVVDLRLGGTVALPVDPLGRSVLSAWGDWGFALTVPDPSRLSTSIIDRDGRLVIGSLPGEPLGVVSGTEVAFTPRPGDRLRADAPRRGFLVEASEGIVTYPSWSRPGAIPVALAVPPAGGWLAIHSVIAPSDGGPGSLVLIGPGGKSIELSMDGAVDGFAWDPSGRWLVTATATGGSIRVAVVDTRTGDVVHLPDAGPAAGAIEDVAVIPG